MSLKEFIFSDEFSSYRKRQITAIVGVLKNSFMTSPELVKGQWNIAKAILNVPANMMRTDDIESRDKLNKLLNEDFNSVYVELARQGILGE